MDWKHLAQAIDAETARAFVGAARNVIDALLIEGERIAQTRTPERVDYNAASLPERTPAGGWVSHDELRAASRRLAEAVATEKWIDGVVCAARVFAAMGG
ncbi:MAG: hypothetical protein D6744_17505 [Planctomycetota bacterium]|nr:MAG: hypothetical protein D6744_17505 [Planctomycetota bacterium]